MQLSVGIYLSIYLVSVLADFPVYSIYVLGFNMIIDRVLSQRWIILLKFSDFPVYNIYVLGFNMIIGRVLSQRWIILLKFSDSQQSATHPTVCVFTNLANRVKIRKKSWKRQKYTHTNTVYTQIHFTQTYSIIQIHIHIRHCVCLHQFSQPHQDQEEIHIHTYKYHVYPNTR